MKNTLLILLFLGIGNLHGADIALLCSGEDKKTRLDEIETDVVRANLIHIFDTSMFHQLDGGKLPVKKQARIKENLLRVESGSHIELILDEPAKIIVEGKTLHIKKLWVSIRESDGFVNDWTFETPDGNLVELEKARGELIVRLAPFILERLKKSSANQPEAATP